MHRIGCECGAMRGTVEGRGLCSHLICYCADCRAFARFLGHADKMLDAQGGTEIVQLGQPRISFTRGTEHLSAVRLREEGLLRWYAGCCNTPIGNTMADRKVAVIGLIHACLEAERINEDFGARIAIVHTASALGESKPRQRGLPGVIARALTLVASNLVSRRYRRSPLFDETGAPKVTPRVLDAEELRSLKAS